MSRKPVVAGQFYESDFGDLDAQIKKCFLSEKGPGDMPVSRGPAKVVAAIVPHAGYVFSGPCAAWAYKEIAESAFPDVFIILGPNHMGSLKTSISLETFETPFGPVTVDEEFAQKLAKKSGIPIDASTHKAEHSIEVQLPFLQFVNKDRLKDIKFVPIGISHDVDYKKLGLDIKETIFDLDRKAVIIASSDFTHYGHNYGYVPFSSDIPKRLYALDAGAIEFIKKFDSEGFLNYVYETGATICGAMAIAVLLNAVNTKKARLLQYYTSSDIIGDYKNAVGYASVLFT
ncbi:MAG: AmmeMemoRadiSam system protein B [bacterium]|nr:AmmeMemoRadiSam system protein B [bacterium]